MAKLMPDKSLLKWTHGQTHVFPGLKATCDALVLDEGGGLSPAGYKGDAVGRDSGAAVHTHI